MKATTTSAEVDLEEATRAAYLMCRDNLSTYAMAIHPRYKVYKHQRKLIRALERVESGECLRLMVLMPPRHGKSAHSSQIFPSWYLGKRPNENVIEASYGSDLARDFGRYVRNALTSPMHRAIFPECELSADSTAQGRFNTTSGGGLYAVGRGGVLTGRGGNLIVLDDLFKSRAEAENPHIREAVWTWYRSVVRTRLAPGARIVIVNTRWHEDDLVGRLLRGQEEDNGDEHWEVLELPAINEHGEALWPECYPVDKLNQVRKDIGTREFESLYQQRPTPAQGSIIKRQWIKYYKVLPADIQQQIQSWDMAFKDTDNSDYVVGQVWGGKGSDCYLIDQVRARMDFTASLQAVRNLTGKHAKAHTKLIEEKANGAAIIATLRHAVSGIVPVVPKESKQARLSAVSPMFEAGNVYLPDPSIAPWVNDFVEELVGFGSVKHDDQVDAATQALDRLRQGSMSYLSKLITL